MFIIEKVCKSKVLFSFSRRAFIKNYVCNSLETMYKISVSGRSHENKDSTFRHFVQQMETLFISQNNRRTQSSYIDVSASNETVPIVFWMLSYFSFFEIVLKK